MAHDLTNKRFGKLTVLKRTDRPSHLKGHGAYWSCICDCGNTKITTAGAILRAINPPNCGCVIYSGNIKNRKYKNPGDVTINCVEAQYKKNAKNRKYQWLLTKEEFRKLISQKCHYCGITGSKKHNAYKQKHSSRNRASKEWAEKATVNINGIDRKDNSKGYTSKNCVSCCEICNKAKRDMCYDEFIKWIHLLIKNFKDGD